ncbi:hypothetical protein SGCOL_005876 [Colletotrichum sp. CLE4]
MAAPSDDLPQSSLLTGRSGESAPPDELLGLADQFKGLSLKARSEENQARDSRQHETEDLILQDHSDNDQARQPKGPRQDETDPRSILNTGSSVHDMIQRSQRLSPEPTEDRSENRSEASSEQ